MLLRFTSADMLNSSLVDVSSGQRAYNIVTGLLPKKLEAKGEGDPQEQLASSLSSHASISQECRHTTITDASGTTLISISWTGRQPDITILGENVGGLCGLFGSSTVRFMPKVMAVPTRFDTEQVWIATSDTVTLFDYDSESIKGTFHQNTIRIPAPFKSIKSSSSHNTTTTPFSFSAPSSTATTSSSSTSSLSTSPSSSSSSSLPPQSTGHSHTLKSSFFATHLPGLGSNYLEFCSHPLAHDVEIILSFLIMEILRRGRFSPTPYTFQKPKMWQLQEARDLLLRRLRRNTV
ncbi:hypothetical protein L208DRAFT_1252598 [Tricholoma matsutake]|nr:hypothetical protein L208DRAFT_1252598 [Tricholoma matsutake 945]